MKRSELGTFGKQVKFYEKARKPYPKEVFQYLNRIVKGRELSVLDLGCGTGISTRQLAKMKIGPVVGCDPDRRMLARAKKHSMAGISKYVVARAERMPFPDKAFDVVTAFSAFHWFDDKKSIKEIMRVLKPGGIFFVAGREGVKSWGEGYRQAIMKAINRHVATFMKARGFDPAKAMKSSGFKAIKKKNWKMTETYSLQGALDYVQSISIWNSVPDELRPKALEGLKEHFHKIKKRKGKILRRLTTYVIIGMKK